MRTQEGGSKIIKNIPPFKSVIKILHYAATRNFEPQLPSLEHYAYRGKVGKGLSLLLPYTTTLGDLKFRQKDRRVGADRL